MSVTINGTTGIFAPAISNSGDYNLQTVGSAFRDPAGNAITPYAGFKNKIINGNFNIWQRGTNQTTSGYGSADRWNNTHTGSTKTTSLQGFTLGQTAVPDEPLYYMRTVVTSVAGAGNLVASFQPIESVRTLAGQPAALSFWAKADASKNIAIEFAQVFGTGGTPSAGVYGIGVTTIPLTTLWQKFTVLVNIPSISGKTIGSAGGDSLQVVFWFDAGSSFDGRTNTLGQQSGTFDIAQVQLEEGSIATLIEQRPIGVELFLCQRYYQTLPVLLASGYAPTNNVIYQDVIYPVQMRTTPTISYSSVTYNNSSNITTVNSNHVHVYSGITITATGTGWCNYNLLLNAEL